jgi:hypothetical protein
MLKCYRCGKESSHDITNTALSDDLITKFRYKYIYTGEKNVLICFNCEKKLRELKDTLEGHRQKEIHGFFEEKK